MDFNYLGLSSATLLQLVFLRESDPNFPWEKFPLGQQRVKTEKKRRKLSITITITLLSLNEIEMKFAFGLNTHGRTANITKNIATIITVKIMNYKCLIYTCLFLCLLSAKYHGCLIKKIIPHKSAAKLFGKNQTTYSCQLQSRDPESVHVVSIFGNHRTSTTHVTVKSQSPSRKSLVLVSYHFVKWTVRLSRNSGISKVFLVSITVIS